MCITIPCSTARFSLDHWILRLSRGICWDGVRSILHLHSPSFLADVVQTVFNIKWVAHRTSVGPVSCILIREHAEALNAWQVLAESFQSRGVLPSIFCRSEDLYKPTHDYDKDGSACRIYDSFSVKRIAGASPCFSSATLIEASSARQPPRHCTRA